MVKSQKEWFSTDTSVPVIDLKQQESTQSANQKSQKTHNKHTKLT